MNEISQEITAVSGQSFSVSDESIGIQIDTQALEGTVSAISGASITSDLTESSTLDNIYNDVHIMMILAILTFAMACMRGWRKNTLRGC